MKKPTYAIGQWVYVFKKRRAVYEKNQRRVFVDEIKPRWGQICGMKRVGIGHRVLGDYHNADDPTYFVTEKFVTFWEVRFGMLNAPVLCADEDFSPGATYISMVGGLAHAVFSPERLPSIYRDEMPLSDQDREALREYAREQKRDSRGRWLPR